MMKQRLFCCLSFVFFLHTTQGVRLNAHISHYEPLALSAHSIATSGDLLAAKFHFHAHERDFQLRLRTHSSLFPPNFHLVVVSKAGAHRKKVSTRHLVIGSVEGEEESIVYGRVLNNSFDGIIHSRGESYLVEPIENHPTATEHAQTTASHHNRVIYKASDVEYDKHFSRCNSDTSLRLRAVQSIANSYQQHEMPLSSILRKKRQEGNLNTCPIRVLADKRFYENIGGNSETNTLDEMALHILNADSIYRDTIFTGNRGDIAGSRLVIHSSVVYTEDSNDPFFGEFSVEELLETLSVENFDDVCLGHLFTYRDYQGTIGLAYLGDPNGQLAGGICQKRTRTSLGDANLNTGLTSFLNFGQKLSRAVTFVTVAHEIGHNYGSPHDPVGECFDGQYIMYPYATSGNNEAFSDCSRESMGRTIEARGGCFTPFPSGGQCGNGVVDRDNGEQCDCGETEDQEACTVNDPCCLVNCTLIPGANCSSRASTCCSESCFPLNNTDFVCLKGDMDSEDGGGCVSDAKCEVGNPDCPPPFRANATSCNNGSNVCEDGACIGSPCPLYNSSTPCECESEAELCHVCCVFDGKCTSTFERGDGVFVAPNFPCKDFTGYCTEEHICKSVNNDDILNNLRDILLDFSSLVEWLKSNWYWVLVGAAAMVILIVLLQVTYRRKKLPTEEGGRQNLRWGLGKSRRPRTEQRRRGTPHENTGLLD